MTPPIHVPERAAVDRHLPEGRASHPGFPSRARGIEWVVVPTGEMKYRLLCATE